MLVCVELGGSLRITRRFFSQEATLMRDRTFVRIPSASRVFGHPERRTSALTHSLPRHATAPKATKTNGTSGQILNSNVETHFDRCCVTDDCKTGAVSFCVALVCSFPTLDTNQSTALGRDDDDQQQEPARKRFEAPVRTVRRDGVGDGGRPSGNEPPVEERWR